MQVENIQLQFCLIKLRLRLEFLFAIFFVHFMIDYHMIDLISVV